MTARLIDGKAISAQVRAEVAERVRALQARNVQPGLAAVLVGDDPASKIYVGSKQKASADVGIHSERVDLPADVSQEELLAGVERLNTDPRISGMIVQLPLPEHISELAVQQAVAPSKDVDCLGPTNVGLMTRGEALFLPATPYGVVEMLVRSDMEIEGADVTIVGRGGLVGMPLAIMLAQRSRRGNATVTLCHTRTRDVGAHTRTADVVVVATGVPGSLRADMVKPGATVVDVGINRVDGKVVGDVAFDEVAEVAGAITPVPGGVGPMTVAMLLVNTVAAAEAQAARG
ncbi:MAG: bifunctional 5,10-methylenetetrahydrofolate dehydrogenase/5,10-methenyltetrahydrofolate cyclohydrolase [Actinomycetota bacterium]|nr:bifunctional 5,10-methylenetetrahydrofolate dehydrogenase/5,10-methenyltetrahydrofolate cyclohydrolase [Actinomycetota bacterium]